MMRAPETRSEITRGWLEYILSDYQNRHEAVDTTVVSVREFKVLDGCKDGDGFVGDIVKLVVQATVTRSVTKEECNQNIEYNLVVKLANQNPMQQYFFYHTGFYIREHLMYTTVIPELNKFQEDRADGAYTIDMPKYIYSKCTDDEFVLVLENLNTEGFSMHSKHNSMELDEVKLFIEQLARLHAVSYAYDKSFTFLNKFPDFYNTDYHRYMSHFETPGIIDVLVDILKQLKGKDTLVRKLEELRPHLIQKAIDLQDCDQTHTILCLNHGDPHGNNILFKHKTLEDGSDVIDSIKVLDWQICQWNTPIYDLQYMINSSTSPEFRKVHLDDLLHYYHSRFTEITDKLHTPVPHWTYDVFQTEYSEMNLFGCIKGIYLNSIQSSAVAKRTKDRERGDIDSSRLWKYFMYNISKLMTYCIFSSFVRSFVTSDLKWRLQPIIDVIISEQDPTLHSKIVGSIVEADENGLFDEVSIK